MIVINDSGHLKKMKLGFLRLLGSPNGPGLASMVSPDCLELIRLKKAFPRQKKQQQIKYSGFFQNINIILQKSYCCKLDTKIYFFHCKYFIQVKFFNIPPRVSAFLRGHKLTCF